MSVYGMKGNGGFAVKKLDIKDKVLMTLHIASAAAADTKGILDGFDPSAGTTPQTSVNFSAQPHPARRISVKAMAAGTADLSDKLIITGYDAMGKLRTERVIVSSTGSAITRTLYPYSKLVSITPDDASHKSDDVDIGWTNDFGLPYPIASSGDVIAIVKNGVNATTSPLGTTNEQYNWISFTPSAGAQYDIMWMTNFQDI